MCSKDEISTFLSIIVCTKETLIYFERGENMDVQYNINEEAMFDDVANMMKEMSEQEKAHFMIMLQGYRAGVGAGKRLAESERANEAQ